MRPFPCLQTSLWRVALTVTYRQVNREALSMPADFLVEVGSYSHLQTSKPWGPFHACFLVEVGSYSHLQTSKPWGPFHACRLPCGGWLLQSPADKSTVRPFPCLQTSLWRLALTVTCRQVNREALSMPADFLVEVGSYSHLQTSKPWGPFHACRLPCGGWLLQSPADK